MIPRPDAELLVKEPAGLLPDGRDEEEAVRLGHEEGVVHLKSSQNQSKYII